MSARWAATQAQKRARILPESLQTSATPHPTPSDFCPRPSKALEAGAHPWPLPASLRRVRPVLRSSDTHDGVGGPWTRAEGQKPDTTATGWMSPTTGNVHMGKSRGGKQSRACQGLGRRESGVPA